MATREDVEERSDGTVVVEAPSVEAALAAVERRFGPNATIIDAERLNTRGVGGFFSKQSYRVVVKADTAAAAAAPAPPVAQTASYSAAGPDNDPLATPEFTEPAAAELAAVDHVLEQVEQGDGDDGRTFGDVLRAQLQNRSQSSVAARDASGEPVIDLRDGSVPSVTVAAPSVAVPAQSVAAPSAPSETSALARELAAKAELFQAPQADRVSEEAVETTTDDLGGVVDELDDVVLPDEPSIARSPLATPVGSCAPGTGRVLWSVDGLSRLGVPYRLIAPLGDLDPDDELAWVYRFAETASGLCGELPATGSMFVGRAGARVARALGAPIFETNEVPPFDGDLAVAGDFDGAAFDYVGRIAAGRGVHLVVDDGPLSVRGEIAAVSWVDGSVCEAMHVAISTGATLAYRLSGDVLTRATPFELALAVRAMLPRE